MLTSGCSAFVVHTDNSENKRGVPFYIQKGQVKQTTKYSRTWIEAEVLFQEYKQGKKIPGSEKSATFAINQKSYNQIELLNQFNALKVTSSSEFGNAISEFQKTLADNCTKQVNCLITSQEIITQSDPYITSSVLLETIEENSSSYESVVDYENPLYFNARIPLFGTATATAKLAPDGTLSEATSTVDSTKLADAIPLNCLLYTSPSPRD